MTRPLPLRFDNATQLAEYVPLDEAEVEAVLRSKWTQRLTTAFLVAVACVFFAAWLGWLP